MRITRQVFHDLAIWMVGFGLLVGVAFPFLALALGVGEEVALRPVFFGACLGAGALAGVVNYALARVVVGRRLSLLAESMSHVEQNLQSMAFSRDLSTCSPAMCSIPVDSEDEIGGSAQAFNRLVEALATSMKTQSAVRAFSEMLNSQLETSGLADHALRQFFESTGAAGGLILYDVAGQMQVAASRGLRNADLVAASEHVKLAVRTGERQIIAIPDTVMVEGVVTDFRPNEVIVFPVSYKSVVIGVVVLASARTFAADHRARMDLFLHGLGLALNNAMVHDRLQHLAAIDPLTGTYNRRFGLSRLHEEFGRAVRASTRLGVLMLDIDHFKVVNDTYGHQAGDQVLKSVCAIARSSLREGDVLMRYGGEEFLAVLPAASAEDLQTVGERVRRAVEESVVLDNEKRIRVTLCVGGAAYPSPKVEQEDTLIQLADQALYRAKAGGRNRVDVSR